MTRIKLLASLAAFTVLFAGAAYLSVKHDEAIFAPTRPEMEKLLTATEAQALAAPSKIVIRVKKKKITIVNKGKEGWVIPAKANYPADPGAIRAFLVGFSQAKRLEPKTNDPKRYKRLGVDKEQAVRAEVYGGTGGREIAFDIGSHVQGRGAYVRRVVEKTVWLASEVPKVTADFTDWILTKPFAADEDAVVAVEGRPAPGEEFRLERTEIDGVKHWAMENVPEGWSVRGQDALRSVASSLSYLFIEDAVYERQKRVLFNRELPGATYYFKDGGIIMLDVAKQKAKKEGESPSVWVRFTALPPPPEPSDPSVKPGDKKELLDYDYIIKLTEGRVFRTPSFVADDLTTKKSDMLIQKGNVAE